MYCLTCNNNGIVPNMTSAVDGERCFDTEICPDCQGESRYQRVTAQKYPVKQVEKKITMYEVLKKLVPLRFKDFVWNLTREKTHDYIFSFQDFEMATEEFKQRILRNLYKDIFNQSSIIL
jgi:hypothetical protein